MIAAALPRWLERLLGVSPAGSGEGTKWGYDTSWNLPPWATLLLLVGCVAVVVLFYLRDRRELGIRLAMLLAGMRSLAILIVLFMLADFVLTRQRTGLPYVVVMVDDSASMTIQDRYSDASLKSLLEQKNKAGGFTELTRFNVARSILLEDNAAWLRSLSSDYKLAVYLVSAAARAQPGELATLTEQLRDLEATGETTRLGDGVRDVLNDLRGTPPAAVILLTDGVSTEGESLTEAAAYAQRKNVPLFCIGLGTQQPVQNIRLADLLVDDVVFVDDVVYFEFKVTATGYEGRAVEAQLHEKGKKEILARLPVTLGEDGQSETVRIPYRPTKVGEFEYVVEIPALEDEENPHDNSLSKQVSVRKEKIRVLMVQSYPSYEFRYLKTMLERDRTVELQTVLQQADLEYAETDRTALRVFPVRRDELFNYDVVLFGDVNPAFLSTGAMENLADFVKEKGGGLLFFSGPMYTPLSYRGTPLADLFPIDLNAATAPPPGQPLTEGFGIQLTELGMASPHMQLGDSPRETESMYRNLPPMYWLLEAHHLKPAARVLAEHPVKIGSNGRKLPIISLQYAGAGKVVFHATDDTWRWRYRLGDVLFARYWVQSIRFLSRAKLLGRDRAAEITVDHTNLEYVRGEPVRIRVRFFDERQAPSADDGVVVVVEHEGRNTQRITLHRASTSRGVFEGVLTGAADGKYRAWIATPVLEGTSDAVEFRVIAPPGEFQQRELDAALLQQVSRDTGGRYYEADTANRLLGDLPRGRQVPIEPLAPVVLWNQVPIVLLLLGLLIGEWIVRKRKGLL